MVYMYLNLPPHNSFFGKVKQLSKYKCSKIRGKVQFEEVFWYFSLTEPFQKAFVTQWFGHALWLAYTLLGNFYLQRATLRMNIWKVNGIQFLSAIFLVEIANISTNNKSSPIFLLQGLTTHNLSIYLTFFLFNNNQCSFLQNSSCLLIKC